MARKNTPVHIRWLSRVGVLIERMEALPQEYVDRHGPKMELWSEWLDGWFFEIRETQKVTQEMKDNIKMSEDSMALAEQEAREGQEDRMDTKTETTAPDAGLWEQRIAEVNQALEENKIERKALLARRRKLERALKVAQEDLERYPAHTE